MSEIIEKVKQIVIDRSNAFYEAYKDTKHEYNIYENHIKYVYNFSSMLSSSMGADQEVVVLSALLHDIAMTEIVPESELEKYRVNHNVIGANIARKILEENNYPKNKIDLVCNCVLNHSSSRKAYRTTQVERILVDCDCLAHFINMNDLYSLAHNVMEYDDEKALEFIKKKLDKDFNEMSTRGKKFTCDAYEKVMKATSIDEIITKKSKSI